MTKTTSEQNKALVLEAFDTLDPDNIRGNPGDRPAGS
jgi:hypothetical protein